MVEISVEDEGPGIPEASLEHIFDRFYSERPKGERFGQHSGLGLSISRQIVEALKGRIAAENRRDGDGRVRGARFVVTAAAGVRHAISVVGAAGRRGPASPPDGHGRVPAHRAPHHG